MTTVSLLAGAPFEQHTLTYSQPTANPNAPATGTVTAFIAPDRARQLQLLPGADEELIPVTCELVTPLVFPTGVGLGSVLTLTWAGVACTLKITSITPNDLVGVPFGTAFLGEVRRA